MPTTLMIAALLAASPPPMVPPTAMGDADVAISEGRILFLDVGPTPWGEQLETWVWLPPSYGQDESRRFPVLYMHDGQNLFDAALTNYNKEWQMDEAISRMAANGDLREWIVVGLRSPKERYLALFPEKLVDHMPPARVAALAGVTNFTEVRRDMLRGDQYLVHLTQRLKPRVDELFRTLAGADDTAVMGSSMGGLMSLYAIAEYPDVFGQAAAVSIHYPLGAPDIEDVDANVADTTAAWEKYLATTKLDPAKNRIYMDHGTATLDQYYPPYADAFDAMMAKHGWDRSNYMSRRYTGAEHDERAWAERVDIPLAFLDRKDP
ncbi:alpha/beta hydrolase [Sphingomicrobium flavum]|uniref:alpha/beta hydrolase n=1 Tax=Sphingomicrobium flavum TaxID=1229164 RepID=UPI0021AE1D39|nr:alpha/beta hydrolase-fold protein [Sphingomicrobium flavum]